MTRRRATIGLSLLCALAFSAISATGAVAETKTSTVFTCVPTEGGAGFSKEHCSGADAVASGAKFKHVEIAPGKGTAFDATNEKTAEETKASTSAVLSATVGGLKAVTTCSKVTVTGEIENFEDPTTKAMDVKSKKSVVKGTECVLSGALATVEGCKVSGGSITSNELSGTSLVNTVEGESKPEVGATFAVIKLESCKTKELNEKGIEITGTAKEIGSGATAETTAASTAGLKAAGQSASLTGKVTSRMINGATLENPISGTTIIDP
jgi:hypothetical protein